MALTASNLIDAARKRTFGAIGRQKVSTAMLLEELTHQDQEIVKMIAQCAPDLLATVTGSITITDAGNTNGYTLSDGIHYRDFTHLDSADERYVPINIVQRQHRDSHPAAPAAMLRTASAAGVFYPIDPRGKRWEGSESREWFNPDEGHEVSYSYIALPGVLSSLSSSLSSPDMARPALVASLVLAILVSVDPPVEEAAFQQHQLRIQQAASTHTAALTQLRMQAYKFGHPSGQPGDRRAHPESASEYVLRQIT